MIKNIVITLLVIISLLSLAYGYSQKNEADKHKIIAIESEQRARQAIVRAEIVVEEAEQQMLRAEMQRISAMAELQLYLSTE